MKFDLVAALFGGARAAASRVIYALLGIAGIWTINLFFKPRVENR